MEREITYKIRPSDDCKAYMNIVIWETEYGCCLRYDGFNDNLDADAMYINRVFDVHNFEDGVKRALNYIKKHNYFVKEVV